MPQDKSPKYENTSPGNEQGAVEYVRGEPSGLWDSRRVAPMSAGGPPIVSPTSPAPIDLTAAKRSKCSCGTWVGPGARIRWDRATRKTVGCPACHMTGEDPSGEGGYSGGLAEDDYSIFHD